ncbi:MAG TPA: hypothetical protein VN255_03830 [Mycobacterium sp.]|nr:hypothetical protein [Mycobacterium sp.]
MTESHEALAAMLQTLGHHELAVETPSPRPVLITEQEVVPATTAAVQARPGTPAWWTKVTGFVVSAIGQTVPPLMETRPRWHYPSRSSYLERAWMQREVSRP